MTRHAQLTRMAERTAQVPTYRARLDGQEYTGHRRVEARGTTFPTLKNAEGRASAMGPLTANLSRLDLTRANAEALRAWRAAT